jgi:putative hemolysin
MTPLIRSLVDHGTSLSGEPAWDPEFNTPDIVFLLPLGQIAASQTRGNHGERKAA